MTYRIGDSRRLLVALLLTSQALFISTTPTSAVSDDSACAELARWAQPFQGTSITLDEFAQFDRAHRLAIFNAVSPEIRAALVQEQLRRFTQRTDLSPTQRALIGEAKTLATPALYDRDPSAKKAHAAFWSRAQHAFTAPEHRRPLLDIGAGVPVRPGASTAMSQAVLPEAAALGVTCNCEVFDDAECTGSCSLGGCSQVGGCGWLGWLTCTGRCTR